MKIALLHLGFFYSGGGEKLVIEELRGLRRLGHEVDCYAPFVDRDGCFPGEPEIGEVRPLLPPPPSWLPMRDPLWVALSSILIPFLAPRFRKYDIFLGANQPGPWFAFVLSRLLRKPYVIYLAQALRLLHPRDVDKRNGIRIREGDHRFLMALKRIAGNLIDRADRLSVKQASAVLTNGDHVSRWISDVYGCSNLVAPAGCHPLKIEQLRYAQRWSGSIDINGHRLDKPFVLLTNRHSPMKRFEYAIWALKALHRSMPGLTLIITGQETEYTEQLRYLVEGLRLQARVRFVGLVRAAELEKLYQHAALYVYPSPEEDFGMGIVEAMAAGTPVVAWRNGGPTVTVEDRVTGYLVTPYDTDEFADRMQQLASSPELAERMGRAGHRRAAENFSYERHNLLLEQALFRALHGGAQFGAGAPEVISIDSWAHSEVEATTPER
jgi:glycosyltransferase involved in cell wall biosynthesis